MPQVATAGVHARGTSWLHRLNPISKLAWVLAVVVVAFASADPIPLFSVALIGLLLALTAGIARPLLRILIVFAPVVASMIVIQTIAPAACADACTIAAQLGPLTLYQEGMAHGLTLVSRLLAMEVIALAVLITTHPSDLFAAFARLRVPYTLNFMLAMTLQLIPILQREVTLVLAAQRSRGMRGAGFGAIIPAFVPVFAGAFERVQQLAISLESRGFGASGPRTSYRRITFGPVDASIAIAGLVVGTVGTVLGLTVWSAGQTAPFVLPAVLTVAIFLLAAVAFVTVIAIGVLAIMRA